VELIMALSSTTLTAAISPTRLSNIPVASAAAVTVGQPLKIDAEFMYCVSVNLVANTVTVRMRGSDGIAVAHDVNAIVTSSASGADWPALPAGSGGIAPPSQDDVVTLGQDQTVTVPAKNTTYLIQKGSAAAITVAGGTAAQVGVQMTFISGTAYAHALTYAGGFLAGANTVATFAAKVGASLVVEVGASGVLSAINNPSANVTLTS